MKRIRIVLVLLCGLMTPFSVQSGEFGALADDSIGGALKGADDVFHDVLEGVEGADTKLSASVEGEGVKATEAVANLETKTTDELEALQGQLEEGKLTAKQAKSAEEAIGKDAEEEASEITEAAKAGETAKSLEEKLGGAEEKLDKDVDASLEAAGETKKEVEQFQDAQGEDRDLIAPGGKPRPTEEVPVTPAKQLAENVNGLAEQAIGLEKGALRGETSVGAAKGGKISGSSDVSAVDQTAALKDASVENPKIESGWQESKRFDGLKDAAVTEKGGAEKAVKESGIVVTKAVPDKPGVPGEPGSATMTIKQGKLTPEQGVALKNTMGGKTSRVIPSKDVELMRNDGKVVKIKTKMKDGSTIERDVPQSDMSEDMLSGEGTWTERSDGQVTFETVDQDVVAKVSKTMDGKLAHIEKLKKDITDFENASQEAINFVQKGYKIAKDGVSSAYNKVAKVLKEEKWATTKKAGSALLKGAGKAVNGILEVVKMMMTGVFFGVPSMIYQTLMQQAAAKALYEQITAVYHITPDFAVQIPASLISPSNAAQAGTYLYVAVDPSTSGYGNDMSSAFLEKASYYVVYQTNAQWGSTYATSPNAFGAWVCIDNAAVFMDGGVPYSEQTPFSYLMEPSNDATVQSVKGQQTTLSVQDYTQTAFDALGNRANYNYSEGFLDSIAPWTIATQSYDHKVTPNSTLQLMFAPVESSVTHGTEKMKKASRYAPKVLVRALNIFRNGIQNVPGFLPGPQAKPPTISIKQFEGTGILNRLLGSPSSQDNIAQSIQLITALASTMSPTSSTATPAPSSKSAAPTPTNVIQAVLDAQAGLKQALRDASSETYGNEVAAASAALTAAQTNLQTAISTNGARTTLGLDPSLDVNAYNIYLYQTEDTPVVQFMKQNRFSDLIPVSDYVVFLDNSLNSVPLFSTAVITRPDGVAVLDFDTSQVNSNIQYMVSLVTGTAYLYNASGPGKVMPSLNNLPAAQYIAGTVMPTLFQQIALVLSTGDAGNLINQILSMANYATNLSYQGPVIKNGCRFEKIPLEVSKTEVAAAAQNALDDALNGVILPQPSSLSAYKTLFGSSVTASQPQLDSMYLYKVSKLVQGSKEPVGVFGTNAAGQPLYDYVVPVAAITNADGTPGFQMMPLGIANAVGTATSGMSGVQMMVSLVTGQVYDNNYCLMANATAQVVERDADFNPIKAQLGQDSREVPEAQSDGTVVTIAGAVVNNLPLATAFMPTFCNPFNITYGSLHNNPQYVQDVAAVDVAQAAVTSAQKAVNSALQPVQDAFNVVTSAIGKAEYPAYAQKIWEGVQGNPFSKTLSKILTDYASVLGLKGEPAGTLEKDFETWIAANAKLAPAQAALTSAQAALIPLQNALRLKVQALQSVLRPPFYPVTKATDQMVIMCPMYWMHYAKFASAAQSANAQTISYTNASQQPMTANINWIATAVSATTTPLGGSLGQVLPMTTILDIANAYNGWQELMNSTSGIAKVMQSGPFQFSKNEKYNVYLTLPPSNGGLDLSTGNFFYSMVPVAPSTSLFVLGDLDPGIAQSISGSLEKNATSGLTAPLTIDQCNTGDRLGHSYLDMLKTNPVAIDLSSGDVWLPTPLGYSADCYNIAQGGNIANAECNVFKIGTLVAEDVLDLALKNQGTTKAQIQTENPGLYSTLMNCQALAVQKAQLALTAYFAGSLLSLCQEQITHGTYIYAVNVEPENYYKATDYWVATDASGNPKGILTAQTHYMVSLVTGNVYGMNISGSQQTAQSTQQDFMVGTGVATIDTPLHVFKSMFGIFAPTLLTPVATNNSKLFGIIESLNNIQNQNFLQSQFSSSANTAILAGQLPLTALQTAKPVSPLHSTLYLVSGKYYLAMPGSAGSPTYYYDFNAELQDVNSNSGTAVYTPIPGDAKRGMYYMVEGTGSAAVATPVSALTGYGCQAMRMRFGIQVAADGTETMGLPVYNPPLPMTAHDVTLKPGASGDNMKCLTSATNITSNAQVTDTYTYYQYKNIASESYLTRCYLNTMIPVYNQATQAVSSVPEYQDYYVDLVTGECYSPDGTPRLSDITVAYHFTGDATTGIVANSALDFSNPLFVWGELDLLGESLQAYMMYQDTNDDPSNGYNQYRVQQYSTSFTLYNGGTPTVYAYEVGADGSLQITQNGSAIPNQTSMSSVLVSALSSGASLATKSYTMNSNGVVPSGTPVAGATVTVTETFVTPKQYMISYTITNADGTTTVIQNMFQTPVTSGTGTAPGASTNTYNNPPLDASLQAQLLQGKPFCARVFASCPYGQETVQNINTTIADATNAVKELALGTTGITCGLLYQPATATSFTLPSAGLLSAIFSGATPNGSGAMNGQYFAFYDCYNNGSLSDSGSIVPTSVVPSKGNYGTYISVVSSMSNDQYIAPYPGLYAGNFNVEFAAASTPATTSATPAAPVITTYGAPYLRIVPLTGALDDSNATAYTAPTSGTEYLYKYQYDIVPNATLAQLKATLNISGNVAGFMQLVSALDGGDLAGVTASNASVNQAAAAVISNQVFYGKPLNALTQEPKGRYVYKLACGSGGADADPTAATNSLCQMFYTAGATNPDTYIDMYNGIVFQSQTTSTHLYPIGFSVSHDQCNAISKMIGGVTPSQDSTALTINTPVITTVNVTKANPKGNLVGKGAALPGQVVKGKVTVAAQAQATS